MTTEPREERVALIIKCERLVLLLSYSSFLRTSASRTLALCFYASAWTAGGTFVMTRGRTCQACNSAEHDDEGAGEAGHGPPPSWWAAGTGLGRRPRIGPSRHSGARIPSTGIHPCCVRRIKGASCCWAGMVAQDDYGEEGGEGRTNHHM